MQIVIPEKLDQRLPSGVYEAAIQKVEIKQSKTGNPKLLVTYTVINNDEYNGSSLYEHYSLVPQALWKLNDFYKQATGEKLPSGAFTKEEFENILSEQLEGCLFNLSVVESLTEDGRAQNEIIEKTLIK